MKQSVLDAQEAYRQTQVAAVAVITAAKQPMTADQVAALTSRDIDLVPAEVYKVHVVSNPVFAARVNELSPPRPKR